jgi:hypothetical protein
MSTKTGAKPIRTEMIQSYIAQLRKSLGGIQPVSEDRLRALFEQQDYTGMVRLVRDNMKLDLRVRVGLVNEGGPVGAPAWVSAPKPMPRFGTIEFEKTLVTVFLRKSFVRSHKFEQVTIAIAHELAHIVLFGIGHPLQETEEAVDLTAMLLGYRDLYVAGSFVEIIPTAFWPRLGLFIERNFERIERRTYRTLGYLTPEEVRYAAVVLGKPLDSCQASPLASKNNSPWGPWKTTAAIVAFTGVILSGTLISAPTTSKAPPPKPTLDVCATRPQPNQGIYARYDRSQDVAPLKLTTPFGSNYFIKVTDAANGRPIRSFYVHGGSTLEALVPAGSFILKYATGNDWCGERDLFGSSTKLHKSDRIFRFAENEGYTVELITRHGGNLRTEEISRDAF